MEFITKKDFVYKNLKTEILDGWLEAGEKIIISRVAKRFEVSEIPVREALNMLRTEGLIEFSPHIGAVVSSISTKDIQEIFEIRIELEGLATRLAAISLDKSGLEELQELIDQSIASYENNDFIEFEKFNYDFHMKIYEYSKNERLYEIIKDLWNHTKRYPSLFKHNKEKVKKSIEEHLSIKDALEKDDGVLAERIMLQHKAAAVKEIIRITESKYYRELQEET